MQSKDIPDLPILEFLQQRKGGLVMIPDWAKLKPVNSITTNTVLEECMDACEGEKYTSEAHITKERLEYNFGCDDCLAAIRNLKEVPNSQS